MTRPQKNILRLAWLGVTLTGSFMLAGFISLPDSKASFLTHSGPDKQVVNLEELIKRVSELNAQKKHQEAIDLLMAALEVKSEDQLLRAILMQTFDMFLQDEVSEGQRAVNTDPKNAGAYLRVASAMELSGDDFRAMEVLLNGIGQNTKSIQLWMRIAKLELKADRPMEAFDIFREVIRLDRKNSDAYNNAAFILAQAQNCNAKDLTVAEEFAENARELDPKKPEYIDTLAEVQFRLGNQTLAQSLLKEAISIAKEKRPFEQKLKKFSLDQSVVEP